MTESNFDMPRPRGPVVKVFNADRLYALTMDPLADAHTVTLHSAETPKDPLFQKMDTTFTTLPGDLVGGIATWLYIGGFYPSAKREDMARQLERAHFRQMETDGNRQTFSKWDFPVEVTIDYGPPTREAHEARTADAYRGMHRGHPEDPERIEERVLEENYDPIIRIEYRLDPFAKQEDHFIEQVEAYGALYGDILRAFYETEGIEPPDMDILLAPPASNNITEA